MKLHTQLPGGRRCVRRRSDNRGRRRFARFARPAVVSAVTLITALAFTILVVAGTTGDAPAQAASSSGDVNCDGEVDLLDPLLIAQHQVGLRTTGTCPLSDPLTQAAVVEGDVDGDGTTDLLDALTIQQCLVGLPVDNCPVDSGPVTGVITIRTTDDAQAVVDAQPPGASFLLASGVHRYFSVAPKDGQTFTGADGAVLDGSRRITEWRLQSGRWIADVSGHVATDEVQGEIFGECLTGITECVEVEQLIVNNNVWRRVASIAELESQAWYFDERNRRIHVLDDPRSRVVALAVEPTAFGGAADNVTIENVTIRNYATPGREGVINPRVGQVGQTGRGWTVRDSQILNNHGVGIKVTDGLQATNNVIRGNGLMGIGGTGDNVVIIGNEIIDNCKAGFNCITWEGGGIKMVGSTNVTIRDNTVQDNAGHGIWSDIGGSNLSVLSNIVMDNLGSGILHEIGYDALIDGNDVSGNGFSRDLVGFNHAGIQLTSASSVEISNNRVVNNAQGILGRQVDRGSGPLGPYEITNLWVHDNEVTLKDFAFTGLVQLVDDPTYFTTRNNRFDRNTYTLIDSRVPFRWNGQNLNLDAWRASGLDVGSTVWFECNVIEGDQVRCTERALGAP